VQNLAQFLEETLDAIPDSVLDTPILRETYRKEAYFAHVDSLLRPRYTKVANNNYESLAPLLDGRLEMSPALN
jgi:tRNA-dihydrouridine synthase A